MNIHLLLEKAEKEGLVNIAKFINENFEREEAVLLTTAVSNYLEKQATFLKIDISDEHKKMMVNCPLFGKMVHIDDVCYGCRFNPATGRFEGHDGE